MVLGLPYAYSFLCGLREICVPILLQFAPGVTGFCNNCSPLYISAPKGTRVTCCLQFPLWVVNSICTDFGSNDFKLSKVINIFSPHHKPAKGARVTLYLQFPSWVVGNMCKDLVQIASGFPHFEIFFHHFPI